MRILLTTLGQSWAIVPELVGLTNPEAVDLYARHPEAERIAELRRVHRIRPVDEVWAITTAGISPESLAAWRRQVSAAPLLRCWRLAGVADLETGDHCHAMADLIYRAVLKASRAGSLYLSLAGGRKTMSADLQRAAGIFGCDLLLHVMDRQIPKALRQPEPEQLACPLPPDQAAAFMPVVVGGPLPPDPVLEVTRAGRPPIRPEGYALALPAEDVPLDVPAEDRLRGEVEDRLREEAPNAVYSALYHLPPGRLEALRASRFGCRPDRETVELALALSEPL